MEKYLIRDRKSEFTVHFPQDSVEVFTAMNSDDLAVIVRAAHKLIQDKFIMPQKRRFEKSDPVSCSYRNEANLAFFEAKYQKALLLYNKALLFAPESSVNAILAISNRSAVSHRLQAYKSCISDVELAIDMGCPPDVLVKMRPRLENSRLKLMMEKAIDEPCPTESLALDRFFEMTSRNAEIKSVSNDIGVIVDSDKKTVAAARDIKVGTVIGSETAYVTQCSDANKYFSCSYCNKFTITLIPCKNCVYNLYCDETCRDKANEEYHNIECHITHILQKLPISVRMAFKAVVKMKNQCKTWRNFITQSFQYGAERVKKSSVAEMYDRDNPASLLCLDDFRHIVHGPMYNLAFDIAVLISAMNLIPDYMPTAVAKRMVVVGALSRTLMALALYAVPTIMPVICDSQGEMTHYKTVNYGWFSFTSKLKNNCNPNVLPLFLNKEVKLIAVKPIKRGTEITIPYLGHWVDMPMCKNSRRLSMFSLTGKFCECAVCTRQMYIDSPLTDLQIRNLRRLQLDQIKEAFSPETIPIIYPKLCKALAFFSDFPLSKEYREIYKVFRKCLHYYQTAKHPQFYFTNFDESLVFSCS